MLLKDCNLVLDPWAPKDLIKSKAVLEIQYSLVTYKFKEITIRNKFHLL